MNANQGLHIARNIILNNTTYTQAEVESMDEFEVVTIADALIKAREYIAPHNSRNIFVYMTVIIILGILARLLVGW